MNIQAITEYSKPFVYLTTGKAFEVLGATVIDHTQWKSILPNCKDVDLLLFESVYVMMNGFAIKELRQYYPKAKFVCLGSDTIYYTTTRTNNGYQYDSPEDVDLFLELMSDPLTEYKDRGINVDRWMWTISQYLIDHISTLPQKTWSNRFWDFISVLSPHTINREGSYRYNMVRYLRDREYNFTRGAGKGMDDTDPDATHKMYGNAKITIGTSSHDNPQFMGVKGYRDAISCFLGSILIYDDYKDVVENYQVGSLVQCYEYGNFESIIDILEYFNKNKRHRELIIEAQKKFFSENTIEKQLRRLLNKHGII